MTPEEFKTKMVGLYGSLDSPKSDAELSIDDEHQEADDLMCDILSSLGYGEGVAIFKAARKWYS